MKEYAIGWLFQDREKFGGLLRNSEDWLYSDGEDQPKSTYTNKLTELQVCFELIELIEMFKMDGLMIVFLQQLGNPIANRYRESLERPGHLEDIFRVMQLTRKAIDAYKAGDERSERMVIEI